MGFNKQWKNKESAQIKLKGLEKLLFKSLKPYFEFDGKLELSKNDPSLENSDVFARILNCNLILSEDKQDAYFGADSINAQQVIVEENGLMKFWGKIHWLSIRNGHESYKEGLDPFYAELILNNNNIQFKTMKFGDYLKTNIDKNWWFDMELNWIYIIEF